MRRENEKCLKHQRSQDAAVGDVRKDDEET